MNGRRIPYAPAEGWVTLGLITLMCVVLALAIDDSRWVLGQARYLDMLVLTAIGGVLCGFIGPKVGWGRWLTYLVGSVFAALIVPLLTGLVQFTGGASLHDLYVATADAVVQAWFDLAVRNLSVTTQYLHHIFVLGIAVWATSMFASYAVFGHHRPLNAVIVVGVFLLGNMAITETEQLPYLVVFSVASLFLLIRSHVFDEQSEWMRRRIGDPASISSVYLRGGTIFIGVAVIASAVLTQTAASAPLAGAFDGVQDGLLSVSRSIQRFLPTGGSSRPVGLSFGTTAQVSQVWTTSSSVALTIERDPTDKTHYYWRAVAYDQIDAKGWGVSTTTTTDRAADAPLFDAPSDVDPTTHRVFNFAVTPDGYKEPVILSPMAPQSVDTATNLRTIGSEQFSILERDGGSGSYRVSALIPLDGNDPGLRNKTALRQASTTYPEDIKTLYMQRPGTDILGPNAQALEDKIRSMAVADNPYDIADAAVKELQSSDFRYDTDIRDLQCQQLSTVECFATFKRGFCQYYAATMAVILRDLGIPTRIAQGFLPGTMDTSGAHETILSSKAHAWVEVYFPGYGWVEFDPTSASVAQLAPLPSGPPAASTKPRPSVSAGPAASRFLPNERDPGPSGGFTGTRTSLGPLLVVGLLLLLVVVVVAFLAWRRGPRGPTSPEGAYGTVTRIASRFGFGPRPAETVYEYATSLGQILPDARPELQTVARAKVESTYARQVMGDERLASLRAAQRRLRVSLLRLAFRRKERRRRR